MRMGWARWPVTVMALVAVLIACSSGSATTTTDEPVGGSRTVRGVVVAVDGTLSAVASFELVLADGAVETFFPEAGLLFDGTAPLSHLRDHLASGEPVEVTYIVGPGGRQAAVRVSDG